MKAQCPHCQAVYNISEAKIPPQGTYGRCTRCKKRFFISRQSTVKPGTAVDPAPKEYLSLDVDGWKDTKYNRMYRLIDRYYRSRDENSRYYISSFCLTYTTMASGDFIRKEVIRLKKELNRNRTAMARARSDKDRRTMERFELENRRHRAMISIFKDILNFGAYFAGQGEAVSYNEILTVLKDVELAHLNI
jgi:predicted Zn finger-like uncharacterized protein